jgi:hypothetical protein
MKLPLDQLIRVPVAPQESFLGHVDGSGRGLDDGECIHCETSGNLEGWECPVRLRERLDQVLAAARRMGLRIGRGPS